MSKIGDMIVKVITDHPENVRFESHTASVRGMEIWTSNMPVLDISIYSPVKLSLPLSDKWKIWCALRLAKKFQLAVLLEKALTD